MNLHEADTRFISDAAKPAVVSPFARDLLAGIHDWRLWTMLGWNDIRQRYRRSVLGPFWITISMGAFIGGVGGEEP